MRKKWPKPVADPEFDQVCTVRKFNMRNGFAHFKEACKTVPTDLPMNREDYAACWSSMPGRGESPNEAAGRRRKGDPEPFWDE